MEKITGTLVRKFLLVFALTQLRIYFFERRLTGPSNIKFCWSSVNECVILIGNKLFHPKNIYLFYEARLLDTLGISTNSSGNIMLHATL